MLGLARPRWARYKPFMSKDPIKPKPGTIYISKFYGWPRAVRIESVAPPPRGGWLATALPSGKTCRIQYARQLVCEAEPDWRAHVARLEAEHRAAKGLPGAEAPAGTPRYDALRETVYDLEERIDALEERLAKLEAGRDGGRVMTDAELIAQLEERAGRLEEDKRRDLDALRVRFAEHMRRRLTEPGRD